VLAAYWQSVCAASNMMQRLTQAHCPLVKAGKYADAAALMNILRSLHVPALSSLNRKTPLSRPALFDLVQW
jgi:hypothetical protein